MVWHSAMLKSEQYSIFYLLISFLLVQKAFDTEQSGTHRYLNLILVFAGVAAGLALITKVQCLFLISVLVLRFFSSSEKNYKNLPAVAINFILFALFIVSAFYYQPNNAAIIGAAGYGLNTFSLFLILILLFPAIQYLRVPERLDFFKLGSRYFIFFGLGILLSFFTHFTLYSQGSTGLDYFLLDFKVVFLRILGSEVYLSPAEYFQRLGRQLELNPFAIVLILLNFYLCGKDWFGKTFKETSLSSLLMFVMLVHLLMIVRNFNSDHLWFDVGLVFITIVHASIVQRIFWGFSKQTDLVLIWLILIGFIVNGIVQYPKKIDNLYGAVSQYGFNKRASLSAVYGGNQPLFNELVAQRISSEDQRVIFENHASRIQEFLPIAKGVFRSIEILPARIGPLSSKIEVNGIGAITVQGTDDKGLQNGFIVTPDYKAGRRQVLWSKNNDVDQLRHIEQVDLRNLTENQFAIYDCRQ
jgi:hypothetical protein